MNTFPLWLWLQSSAFYLSSSSLSFSSAGAGVEPKTVRPGGGRVNLGGVWGGALWAPCQDSDHWLSVEATEDETKSQVNDDR